MSDRLTQEQWRGIVSSHLKTRAIRHDFEAGLVRFFVEKPAVQNGPQVKTYFGSYTFPKNMPREGAELAVRAQIESALGAGFQESVHKR